MLAEVKKTVDALKPGGDIERFDVVFQNTQQWTVTFPSASFIEDAPDLFNDLETFASRFQKRAEVVLEIDFPDEYPNIPPFVRVVSPRFAYRKGHVTVGGSMCTEILTTSGWRNMGVIQLILFLHNLLIDGKGRIDMSSPHVHVPYSFDEAQSAFKRNLEEHGWAGMKKQKK